MKKRILYAALIMSALLLLGLFSPYLYWGIPGLARGEAFYAGMPTSYWRGVMNAEIAVMKNPQFPIAPAPSKTWTEHFSEWKNKWFKSELTFFELSCTDPAAIPVVCELFHDKDPEIRAMGAIALCQHGAAAKDDLPDLLEYVRTGRDENARYQVAFKLHTIGGLELLPILCAWHNEDEKLAEYASYAIVAYGEQAESIIEALIKNLERAQGRRSAKTLADIGTKTLPLLKPCLKSTDVVVRRNATKAIADLADGRLVWESYPPRTKADEVKKAAELAKIDVELVDLLILQLNDPAPQVRREALPALGTQYLQSKTPDLEPNQAGTRELHTKIEAIVAVLHVYNDDPDESVATDALTSLSLGLNRGAGLYVHETGASVIEAWFGIATRVGNEELAREAKRALARFDREGNQR